MHRRDPKGSWGNPLLIVISHYCCKEDLSTVPDHGMNNSRPDIQYRKPGFSGDEIW